MLKREISLVLLNLLSLFDIKYYEIYIVIVGLLLLISHLYYWRSTRWQMIPSHIVQVSLLYHYIKYHSFIISQVYQIIGVLLCIISLISLYVLPLSKYIMNYSGPHAVATRLIHVKKGDGFNIRLFYPASATNGVVERPYLSLAEEITEHISSFGGVPKFITSHLKLLTVRSSIDNKPLTPSVLNLQSNIERQQLPLIVFSHGLGGVVDIYQSLILRLASHGFIIGAVEHNDGSQGVTQLWNKRQMKYRWLKDLKFVESDLVTPCEERSEFDVRNNQLKHRVLECSQTVDILMEHCLDKTDPLYNIIDFDEIGIMGHSFGAATAMQTAYYDKRFRSCVNLDGWMMPLDKKIINDGLDIPVLVMMHDFQQQRSFKSETWVHSFKTISQILSNSHSDSIYLWIPDIGHQGFSDIVFHVNPFKSTKFPERVHFTLSEFIRSFFVQMLIKGSNTQKLLKYGSQVGSQGCAVKWQKIN